MSCLNVADAMAQLMASVLTIALVMLIARAMSCCVDWAARYNVWLPIKVTPKGVVFSVFSHVVWPCYIVSTIHVACRPRSGISS